MSQIGDLRGALRDNLKTIPGVSVSRYRLFDPTPPGIHMWPSRISYRESFGTPLPGVSEVEFTVEAFVSFTTDIGAQDYMDEFLSIDGERSVPAAIETDLTLGGHAQSLFVQASDDVNVGLVTADNRPMLTSSWLVTIKV